MERKQFINFVVVNEADEDVGEREFPDYCATIQSGCALAEKKFADFSDDEGEYEISERNPSYSEFTALYWVWKNVKAKYIGWSHYRRQFRVSEEKLQAFMEDDGDLVLPYCYDFSGVRMSMEEFYKSCHPNDTWDVMMEVLRERDPAMFEFAQKYFQNVGMHPWCMGIYKYEHLNAYCTWLFPILEEIYYRVGEKWDRYQNRYVAFLGERLHSLYFAAREDCLKTAYCDCEIYETRSEKRNFSEEELLKKVEACILNRQAHKAKDLMENVEFIDVIPPRIMLLYEILKIERMEECHTDQTLCRGVNSLSELFSHYQRLTELVRDVIVDGTEENREKLNRYVKETKTSDCAVEQIIGINMSKKEEEEVKTKMEMDLVMVKEKLIEISTCFYQERVEDGMGMFLDVVALITNIPEFAELITPLFDAVEKKDYVLAADIFYHEMAMRIRED